MDKETFLESGLLEQYALGIADPAEEQVVEQMFNLHPELRQEVEDMRRAIEQYALQHAIPPPPAVKTKIQQEIERKTAAPQQIATTRSVSWLNVVVIGALVVLCTLTALRMRSLQVENKNLQGQLVTCESREKIVAFLKDPQTQPMLLLGTAYAPQAAALVYWNEEMHTAMINPFKLSPLKPNQQYQIWADVDGKMVNAGLISTQLEKYQSLKYLPNAKSLNITIEPLGGSQSPTVSRLVANHAI
jgi:anti-sigma-K factor RskA